MTAASEPVLRRLPAEPWGRRLLRAREDVANLTMDQATALLGQYILITSSTISRLEKLPAVPAGKRQGSRRQRAYLLCLCYGVDPADFDLSPDDLPPAVVIPPRTLGSDGRPVVTRWYPPLPAAALAA